MEDSYKAILNDLAQIIKRFAFLQKQSLSLKKKVLDHKDIIEIKKIKQQINEN